MTRKRVVILGAGSAGLSAAMELKKAGSPGQGLEITLVDQHNYHLFLPLLYQVSTGGVEPGHICFSVRSLLRGAPVKFRESRVTGIDLGKKRVVTDDAELEWDYLVIALGSTTNFFSLAEIESNAFPLKTLRDAVVIHNHILDNYEAAVWEQDSQRRRELLTFVIVGGGATGVELASSIQDFVHKVLKRDYPTVSLAEVRVVLAEAQGSILSNMDRRLREVALSRLRSHGTEVLLNTSIVRAWPGGVKTTEGQVIPTRTVIWVAGVKPVSVVAELSLDQARDGRIVVEQNLEAPGLPGVYIAGDCAYLRQEERSQPFPPTGQIAVRQGLACARNIIKDIRGQPQEPFSYKYKGELISMGRNAAVAQLGGYAFDGFAAWLLWRIYYLGRLMGFKNKLSIALDWSFAYFYRRNTARLE